MQDFELQRFGNILERLAYEDDVRKIIKLLISPNNEIDQKSEKQYLNSQKRDHSQQVVERGNESQQQ